LATWVFPSLAKLSIKIKINCKKSELTSYNQLIIAIQIKKSMKKLGIYYHYEEILGYNV